MKRKVRITSLPKAQSGFEIKMNAGMGFNANQLSWPVMAGEFSAKDVETRSTILPVKNPEEANLEAELGETVVTDLNGDGITEHYRIGGKRHYDGGTMLNLPEDSFIFSRDRSMKIKDEDVLKMFNKTYKRSGYTPADIAKQYDINKYRKILADQDSDDLQRKTAEMMIANYNLKLGKLALAQESLKGYPQGIPKISMPYLEEVALNPLEFTQTQGQQEQPEGDNMAKYGKEVKSSLPKAQLGLFNRREKAAGMRYNPTTGVYEVLDRNGNVIGLANPGEGYNPSFNLPGGKATSTETTTTTKKKVKRQVIPDDAEVIDRTAYNTEDEYIKARDEAFAKAAGKKKIYTKASDGKYYTVGEKEAFGDDLDSRLKYLEEKFSDPKVKEAFANKIKKAAESGTNLKSSTGLTKKDIENMKEDDLVKEFLEFNKRNLSVAKFLKENKLSYSCYDNSGKFKPNAGCDKAAGDKYKDLKQVYEAVGMPMDYTKDKKKAALQQLSYIGYKDLIDDKDAGKLDKDLTEKLKSFEIQQIGVKDEDLGKGKGTSKVSPADSFYTNTTAGQVAGITEKKRTEDLLGETEVEEEEKAKKSTLNPVAKSTYAPWFAQDILKTGWAASDLFRTTGTPPWQANAATYMPEAVLADPSQAIATTTSMANTLGRQLGTYGAGKKLSSQASDILGKLAQQSSQEIANYANMNVGIMNNYLAQKNSLLNQASRENAAAATNLFDKQTIFEQQLANEKAARRENLRNAYITALNNKVNAYNTNLLSNNYAITPESGGQIVFTGPTSGITPDPYGSGDEMMQKFKRYKEALPGVDDKVIYDIMSGKNSATSSNAELSNMLANSQGMIS